VKGSVGTPTCLGVEPYFRGFMIASVADPFGNILGLRFDPQFSLTAPGGGQRMELAEGPTEDADLGRADRTPD
jgi:hypothetical protein